MRPFAFGWTHLYRGNRFLAPLSELALLEAGRAAGLAEGTTLLDVFCGNGASSVFWAEEFRVYVRCVTQREFLPEAREHARRCGAPDRLRFFDRPEAAPGPVDVVSALRQPARDAVRFLRTGGRLVVGRYVAPPDLEERFPTSPQAPGSAIWTREATPLEWERFLGPQERALRVYRRRLPPGEPVSDIARDAEERIRAFRANAGRIRYELAVNEV